MHRLLADDGRAPLEEALFDQMRQLPFHRHRVARLVRQVHDELLLETPETETSAIKALLRQEMCGAYPLDPPLAVDVGVGDDWNEAKS